MGEGGRPVWDLRRPRCGRLRPVEVAAMSLFQSALTHRALCSPFPYLSQRKVPLCLLGRIKLNVTDKGLGVKLGHSSYICSALDCWGWPPSTEGPDYRVFSLWAEGTRLQDSHLLI